jgi:hypothetical protein
MLEMKMNLWGRAAGCDTAGEKKESQEVGMKTGAPAENLEPQT